MFYFFLLSVVLFYVLFFSLAAKYIAETNGHLDESPKLAWGNPVP